MAKYSIEDTTLIDIANAIRSKTGSSDGIKVEDMATEIESVPTYITVATEEEATDTATIPIVEGQVIVVTGA